MAKRKEKPFQFPQHILEKINECSNGGFLLFTFDDKGTPVVHIQFDSTIQCLALQKYIENWIETVNSVSLQMNVDEVLKSKPRKK